MKVLALSCLFSLAIVGCSKYTAEDYFQRGQQALEAARHAADTLSSPQAVRPLYRPALDAYSSLMTEYPKSPQAEEALFTVGTIQNNDLHDPAEAISYFRRYVDLYPDGSHAHVAMFLIGFLYNNELHDTAQAAPAYRRFLEKYPHDEMALSAQMELNTLGKSPDELIQKQVAAAPAPPKQKAAAAPTRGRKK